MKSKICFIVIGTILFGLASTADVPAKSFLEVTILSAQDNSAQQLMCSVCIMDPIDVTKPFFNESNCNAYYRTDLIKTNNKMVTFNKNFGRTKSSSFSNQTTMVIIQLWSGEPTEDTANIIGTEFASVGQILFLNQNGKEQKFVKNITGTPEAWMTYKILYNGAWTNVTSIGLMMVTFLVCLRSFI